MQSVPEEVATQDADDVGEHLGRGRDEWRDIKGQHREKHGPS
jgi:hypothetical protein